MRRFSHSAPMRISTRTPPARAAGALGRRPALRRRRVRQRPRAAVRVTTATAAAVAVCRHLDGGPAAHLAEWLLAQRREGGFFAERHDPVPDLLSTATALHALTSLRVAARRPGESCLDFVDTLWTSRGGFLGSWADDAADCEYTYYGLLSLGHLSLAA